MEGMKQGFQTMSTSLPSLVFAEVTMPVTCVPCTAVIACFDRVVLGEDWFFKKNTVNNNWS